MRVARCILTSILALVTPAAAWAQAVANAQIHGVVIDSTGASVPGADVKATQSETGRVVSTQSSSAGSYVLPNLPVGSYTLQVTAPNFSTFIQTGILLQVSNDVLVNVPMQVGSVNQQVQVTADAAMVQTQDTTISQVMDQRRIVDLPLNGRQATDLILLSGGAAIAPGAAARIATTHNYPSASAVSVAGGQENGNNYLLDGGDNNDSHSNVNLPFPFPDALQEFSVQTNGVPARYGIHPGAVVNVVTKSGTNSIHGDAFEFVRNGAFNARNPFAATQDSLRRNQYGATIGGPAKKDKIFLFGGFQETATRTAPPQSIAFVPTQATLNGDFSAMDSAGCQANNKRLIVKDPTTGVPFANDFINPSFFSTPSKNLLKNIPISTDPTGCGKLVYSIPNPSNENQVIGRADWVQSSRHTLYGRYFVADFTNPVSYTNNLLTTTRSGLDERNQAVTIGDNFVFSPTFINSFHATYTRLMSNRSVAADMPSPVSLGVNMTNFVPNFINLGVTNFFTVGGGSNAPALFGRNQFQYADDIDFVRGRHHMSFGVDFMAIQMEITNISNGNGSFTFNGSLSNSGLADFLLGRPSALTDGNPNQAGLRERYWGVYAQDAIQLTKKLNVTLGVRWEPSLPQHDIFGRGSHFDLASFIAGRKSTVYDNSPAGLLFHGDPGIPLAYANGSYLDFAPRIGVAWDPTGTGKESIRASYGIFFDLPESYTNGDFGNSSPWGSNINLTAPIGGFANPFLGVPGGNPFPTPLPPPKNVAFAQAATYINLNLNLHHIYMQQWNLSLERQLGANWLASAAFMGNKATHLRAAVEADPAVYIAGNGKSTVGNTNQRRVLYLTNPAAGAYYSTITQMDDGVNTSYSSLRLSIQHRFANHFTALSVYTYSHCMADSETIANRLSTGSNSYQNPYNRNADYASCDVDLRHNLVNSVVYETPKFSNRATNWVLGNWKLSFQLTAHSGFLFNTTSGADNSLTGVGQDRPNAVGNPYVRSGLVWLDPNAFLANLPGTYGNLGFNALQGPAFFNIDSALSRAFPIHEAHRLELRFEFFNSLNHTNLNNPVSNFRSGSFGQIQSASDPRILQFAMKYTF
jgi:hypothetical protein